LNSNMLQVPEGYLQLEYQACFYLNFVAARDYKSQLRHC
jgi:hypothetical protein